MSSPATMPTVSRPSSTPVSTVPLPQTPPNKEPPLRWSPTPESLRSFLNAKFPDDKRGRPASSPPPLRQPTPTPRAPRRRVLPAATMTLREPVTIGTGRWPMRAQGIQRRLDYNRVHWRGEFVGPSRMMMQLNGIAGNAGRATPGTIITTPVLVGFVDKDQCMQEDDNAGADETEKERVVIDLTADSE
ncbi:hypothetical protein EDC01DRAFT_629243 [Geopyxis carbonaria]|nr:hypothetical protein EDC01DRAFT_629243 [Geopyxis carbonaria]